MKIADAFLHKSEEVVWRKLETIADDNGLRAFAKPRLSDVIVMGDTWLTQREFNLYTRAHVDFLVTDSTTKRIMIIEYDGPSHADSKQMERDKIKDALYVEAGLGILRINANHVTRMFRGISILRWIVEVVELQKWFEKAQAEGRVSHDEPFDPVMIADDGRGRKWPYWLSVSATQSILSFFRKFDKTAPKGHASILGSDSVGNKHSLSFIWFDDKVIWAKTAVRPQNVDVPSYDLLTEIATCEVGIKLSKFRRDEIPATSISQFKKLHDSFCERYNAHPCHQIGAYPFNFKWTLNSKGVFIGENHPRNSTPGQGPECHRACAERRSFKSNSISIPSHTQDGFAASNK